MTVIKYISIGSDAIASLGSGVQMVYGEYKGGTSDTTINCNFYPIIIFVRRNSYSSYHTAFVIRPETSMIIFNKTGSSYITLNITWNDTSVKTSGISEGYTYTVLGT